MPEQDAVELRWVLEVIRRWLWLIVGCALLGVIGALASAGWMPPVYSASVTLLIQPARDSRVSDSQYILTGQSMARTYAHMLQEASVLEAAAEKIQLREPLAALAQKVQVQPIADTQLIRLTAQADSGAGAALFANAIAETFIQQVEASQAERNSDSLTRLQNQMAELSAQIETTDNRVDALGVPTTSEDKSELAHLEDILAAYRNTYATLLQNYEQMRLTAASSAETVTIAEAARAPQKPIERRPLYLAVAGLVGAILGLACAFLLERMDETIKTPHDVRRVLGLRTLGTICRMSKAERGLIVKAQPQSAHAEAFRILCTNLGFFSENNRPKTILVTSPTGSEGKSLIAANLAMTLAQAKLGVVAVDADMRRPTLGQFFDLDPRSAGLSSALLTGKVDGLLRHTEAQQLAILTSGNLPPSPAQLLRSSNMQDLLGELAQRGEVTVIDGPPVLPVADTALIAQRMDGVVLVIRAGRTRREAAQSAVESLAQTGTHVIGVVLNGVDPRRSVYHSTYHKYMKGVRVEEQPPLEQARDDASDEYDLGQSAEGELVAQLPQVLETPAWQEPMAELVPGAPAMPNVQGAAALAEDRADRLPGSVATSPAEKDWRSAYESFAQQDLSGVPLEYLFLDALHKPLPKPRGEEEDILCAWAINTDGREVLVHVATCNAESYEMWLDFLRDIVERGLSAPVLAIAHGTSGVMRAVGEVFPNSLQQRCLSIRIHDVSEELPKSARAEVMAMVQAAYYAPNPRVAEGISADTLQLYAPLYPSAMRSFRSDWETCIAYLRCPPVHHSRIRTTTLLRRSFVEERRRTIDSSPPDAEKGSLERVFALLWQSSQRWQGIRMGEAERQQLRLLRRELGLPDGGEEAAQPGAGRPSWPSHTGQGTRPGDEAQHFAA